MRYECTAWRRGSEQAVQGWSVWSGLTGVSGLWHLKGSEEERDREWVEFGRNRGRAKKEGWEILQCLHQPLSSSINSMYSWEAGRGPLFCICKIDREREQLPWPASSLCCCTHACTHVHTTVALLHQEEESRGRHGRTGNTAEELIPERDVTVHAC